MNALMNPYVTASAKAAAWLLVWSWQAAILITCVWAGMKIFRAQSPALRHQIWLLSLIAVIAMPALSAVSQSIPTPGPNSRALSYAAEFPRIVITNEASPLVQNQLPTVSARTSIKQPIILCLSFVMWITGVCVIAARTAINAMRARRLSRRARRASLTELDCEECDCDTLRDGKVSLAQSDEIRSPILLGALRPMILLPADIVAWSTPEERRAMLRHELAHVKRRDHFVNLFQTLVRAVFYFHPLARYACRQLAVEREMACDDHVVSSGVEAMAYAQSIIKAAERGLTAIGAPASAPHGAHQLALFSARQILERRIEMIMNKDRVRVVARQWRYLVLPVVLIAVVAWLLIPGRLTRSGLAQPQAENTKSKLELVKYMGAIKAHDDLIEMALRNPDAELRRLATIQLTELEGDGSARAMVELYNKSDDPEVKRMVIETLARTSEIEPLTSIALSDPSPDNRLRALERIKWLKRTSESSDIKAWDAPGLQDQLNGLSQEPPAPPPPPPPPTVEMTVEADKPLTAPRWSQDRDSVFALLREAVDAGMRHDASFYVRVLDEDYIETGPSGETINKEQAIADVKRLDHVFKKFEFNDLNVSGNEQMAFATFLGTVYFVQNGQDSTAQYRYTVNFIRRDGQLKIAAVHMTLKQ